MMKHVFYFLSILVCFGVADLTAQEPTVELSADYKIPKSTILESILTSDRENIYLLRKDYSGMGRQLRSVIIESYDRTSLKLKKAIDIDLKYNKKLRTFHQIFMVKDNMFLITSFFNSAKDKNFLFAQKLNSQFVPSDNLILIGEIDSRNEAQTGDFLFDHSLDTSKIIIFNDIPTKRNENERAKITVFDAEFNKLWDKKINFPFESKLYERRKFEVDNKGNAYILGKRYFEKRKNSRNDAPNYEFVLEAYTNQGEEKDKYQLNSTEKFISNLTFKVNNKEQIICTGFYSDVKPRGGISDGRNNRGTIRGIVFFSIDNVSKIIAEKTYSEFDLEFIALNESARQRNAMERRATDDNDKNDPGLFSYDFRDIILRSDGGAVVIAEQYFAFDQINDPFFNNGFNNRGFNNNFRLDSIHVFSDIIVVNINPNGSIQWANAVPKYQSSFNYSTYRFLSFGRANYRDKIYMLFNERVDLFEADTGGGLFGSNAASYGLAMATIDKSGELEIELLAKNSELGVQVLPSLIKQIGKKEVLFYGESGTAFRIGTVKIE
jgi:hypothetical protein